MDITGTSGTLTFDITPEFFPTLKSNWFREGTEVSVVDTVPVHGWISDDSDVVVRSRGNSLRNVVLNKVPVVFKFRDDAGNTFYQLNHAHITDLEDVPDEGGSFVNHVEFRCTVTEERGVRYSNIVAFSHVDELSNEQDEDGT